MELRPVEKTPRNEEIVRQLTRLISKGKLKPGDRLPSERELCKKLEVGRTSLREALRTLAIVGVLDVRVGEGTFVAPGAERFIDTTLAWGILTDPKDFKDLVESRRTLETQIAALAAQRISPEDEADLQRIVDQMEEAVDSDRSAFSQLDMEFHLAIAKASHNMILQSMLAMIRAHLQEVIVKTQTLPRSSRMALQDHKAIFGALQARDPEGARLAMQKHITHMAKNIDRVLLQQVVSSR